MFWYKVPAPDEALLISGSRKNPEGTPFRIVTGHGKLVWPIKQKARFLSLSLRESEIAEDCVTKQGIRLRVRAVAVFKVGDDPASIANAARRFLTEQNSMEERVGRIFSGHLRSIVGGLTVEEIIRERDRVSQEIKDGSHIEMEKLGLVVDSIAIQEIEDSSGYINNLAAPHAAAVASQARIAAARADQQAAQEEQAANANKAQYVRDASIKQAGYQAEVQEAQAKAAQAGPLAEAQASQEVIEQQTALAERQADLAAQRLEADVRRPADAEAYKQRTLAAAARDKAKLETEGEAFKQRTMAEATAEAAKVTAGAEAEAAKFRADGEAYSRRAVATADADAINARADALSGDHQSLIAANRLVEILPDLVQAAGRGIAGSNLTVLNGTQGVNEVLAGVVSQGLTIYESLRQSLPEAARPNVPVPVRDDRPDASNGTAGTD